MAETGKAVGAGGLGLMALLGGLAKHADDCGRVGARAAYPVAGLGDDAARGLGRGAPGLGKGAPGLGAPGLGKGAPGLGRPVVPVGGLGDDVARAGDGFTPHLEAGRAAEAGAELEEALIEAGAEIAIELGSYAVDVGDDVEPPPPRPVYVGMPKLLSLDLSRASMGLESHAPAYAEVRTSSSLQPARVLDQLAQLQRLYSPVVVLGRMAGEGLRLGDERLSVAQVLGRCAHSGVACVVLACGEEAAETCEANAVAQWWEASSSLPGRGPAGISQAVSASFDEVTGALLEGLLRRLPQVDEHAFVARLTRTDEGLRVVTSRAE